MKWRIMVSGKLKPNENMAIDEAILNGVIAGTSDPTIRFYDWDPPTASLGYHQQFEKEVDFNQLNSFGWGIVKRPTGGRLVLHIDEVTYAVIGPMEGYLAGNLTQSYSSISLALAEGLRLLDVEVEFEKGSLSTHHQREANNPCFTSSSRYELKYEGKKMVGSAQVRRQNALLQHGSILLDHDQSRVVDIMPDLDDLKRERLKKFLAKKSIAINQVRNKKVEFSEAVSCFIEGFQKIWEKDEFYFEDKLSIEEQEEVTELIGSKYSS